MKKTLKTLLIACFALLVSVLVFAACTAPTSPHTHTVVIREAIAPTYDKTGLTAGAYCSTCGEVLVAQEIVPATGSVGLSYTVNADKITCTITGIGTCTDTKINIPRRIHGYKVIGIDKSAFSNCENITSVTLPNSVITIGERAFSYCKNLTSVTISDSVITIGKSAFASCPNLTSVTIGDSVTVIGDSAFWDCPSLTSITIPNSVTVIGEGVFHRCSKLTSITIPHTVTSIGKGAFQYCSKLTSITFEGTRQQWNSVYKGDHWNYSTGNYTVYCTDCTIAKNGTITEK